jgi:hypothetical protein
MVIVESAAVTKSTVSTKETKKEGDNKKKNQPEYWAKVRIKIQNPFLLI